ncbi:TraR/DksA family transcriptional regulator [Ruicaihuangia caeni]|uniref:TraR/DksA C4-type zinc finger protein n=1 Tax=Ruicaihuangia caeni TaxID=3042517 RepID=A0AAW6T6I1_9MICO|nr:TraR/DksA C4-type zinc finger protein [Klugiella sp. YN-L-19]MDI2098829.1 TraR/DksA C4-type zinc finger protein [Klugiella sp. YN-L-19]
MDAVELDQLSERLVAMRQDAVVFLQQLERELETIRSSRADGSADDEHDPEGPTMSHEWSRVTALVETARADLHGLDEAVRRVEEGTYGVCRRCGGPIAPGRLEARPTAELCIDCAQLAATSR